MHPTGHTLTPWKPGRRLTFISVPPWYGRLAPLIAESLGRAMSLETPLVFGDWGGRPYELEILQTEATEAWEELAKDMECLVVAVGGLWLN